MVEKLTYTAYEMFPASGIPVAYTNSFEYYFYKRSNFDATLSFSKLKHFNVYRQNIVV